MHSIIAEYFLHIKNNCHYYYVYVFLINSVWAIFITCNDPLQVQGKELELT